MDEEQETQFHDQPVLAADHEEEPTKKQDQEAASNINGGQIWIKLKMPKSESSEQADHQYPCPPLEFSRICEVCNKGFHSPKALGGHMRMHVQANKELLIQSRNNKSDKAKLMKNNTGSDFSTSSYNGGMEPVCCVCGKSFPSMKSLFGHMRSHPEREWRGIQPPPSMAAKNSSSSTLSDAVPQSNNKGGDDQIDSDATKSMGLSSNSGGVAVDLSKTLPGWSLTAKRGRKSSIASSASDQTGSGSGGLEEQMNEAVHDLMMLAQAKPCYSSSGKDKIGQLIDHVGSSKKRKFENRWSAESAEYLDDDGDDDDDEDEDEDEDDVDVDDGKGKAVLGSGFGPEKSVSYMKMGLEDNYNIYQEQSDSQNSESIVLASIKRIKKRRKVKLVDLEGVMGEISGHGHRQSHKLQISPNPHHRKYSCSICNKSFQTHQALGGHMSSHNKLKNNNNNNSNNNNNNNNNIHTNSMDDHSASAEASAAEDGPHANNNLTTQQVDHEAETMMVLDQEVAQHKCKICKKTFPTGQALGGHKRCHWTGPNEAQSSNGRKLLNFDLNELPFMEDEQGTGCGGYFMPGRAEAAAAAGCATSSYNSVT